MSTDSSKIKEQIILNVADDSFMILHSDSLDLLDVYILLQSALEYIEEEAKLLAKHGGSYLQ